MRGKGEYWEEEKERLCRMCSIEIEEWKHVWEDCGRWRAEGSWEKMVEKVLRKEGEGEEWLSRLEEPHGSTYPRNGCSY